MADSKLYGDRKPWELEPHYSRHVSAMTSERLHEKSAIAAELAARDAEIERARIRTADELTRLRAENSELRRQLTNQTANNHARNVELDALHYVWCDGGCKSGTHRWTEQTITEEVVATAERNTLRLRRWFNSRRAKTGGIA